MAQWRVYNRHPDGLTHRENYKENLVVIPAGGFVLMDYEDAVQFRGQYFPMKRNAQGAPDPTGFKVIELVPHEAEKAREEVPVFICNMDGRKFQTQADLDKHISTNYADRIFKDEKIEEEIAAEKRRPGRPAKEKTA